MSAKTLEKPETFLAFEYDFSQEINLADCECAVHENNHTAPGNCGRSASWRLTARAIMGIYSPVVSELLCRECLDSHVKFIEKTRPTVEVQVRPI